MQKTKFDRHIRDLQTHPQIKKVEAVDSRLIKVVFSPCVNLLLSSQRLKIPAKSTEWRYSYLWTTHKIPLVSNSLTPFNTSISAHKQAQYLCPCSDRIGLPIWVFNVSLMVFQHCLLTLKWTRCTGPTRKEKMLTIRKLSAAVKTKTFLTQAKAN